ncbi:MAG: hypothetical protein KAK00_08965 [Nanoarchaeota archaeon]|nr:hypothetical protein [Nanoarchaeota archaeon]
MITWLLDDPINNKDNKLELRESNYQAFKRTNDKIANVNLNIHDPSAESKADSVTINIERRKSLSNQKLVVLNDNQKVLKQSFPNPISVFFKDLFFEPNYNLSEAKLKYEKNNELLDQMKDFISRYRFNSALAIEVDVESNIVDSNEVINKEKSIKRNWGFK